MILYQKFVNNVGRPWTQKNGNLHKERFYIRLWIYSYLRTSLNLYADLQLISAIELSKHLGIFSYPFMISWTV